MAGETWIPITERLPDEKGSYWITTIDGTVHLGYMKPDGSGFRRRDAVAWMPYPPEPEPAQFVVIINNREESTND